MSISDQDQLLAEFARIREERDAGICHGCGQQLSLSPSDLMDGYHNHCWIDVVDEFDPWPGLSR